jgi:hypothetical protein
MFPFQPLEKIKFEVCGLSPDKLRSKRFWGLEETALFLDIMKTRENETSKVGWKQVSYQLYSRSEGRFFRAF